jgi:hypothetical protein
MATKDELHIIGMKGKTEHLYEKKKKKVRETKTEISLISELSLYFS